jgi:hypothetical protein
MVLFASGEWDGDKEGASEVDEEKCLSFEARTTTARMRIRSRIHSRYWLYNSVSSTDHTFDAWSATVSASTCQQYHAWEDKLSSHHIQLQTFSLDACECHFLHTCRIRPTASSAKPTARSIIALNRIATSKPRLICKLMHVMFTLGWGPR